MALLTRQMREDLAIELGYLHNFATGRRSTLCKIPFFFTLEAGDLIVLGCRLRAQKFGLTSGHVEGGQTGAVQSKFQKTYIMKEDERGETMYRLCS